LSLKFIVVEARIEARLSKLETRVASNKLRDSTRLLTPLDARPSSCRELTRLPTPDDDGHAGNGGQVQASSPLNVNLSHEMGLVAMVFNKGDEGGIKGQFPEILFWGGLKLLDLFLRSSEGMIQS
jgi:hypothetical protein